MLAVACWKQAKEFDVACNYACVLQAHMERLASCFHGTSACGSECKLSSTDGGEVW